MADKLKGVIQEATFNKATFEDKPVTIEFAPINFLLAKMELGNQLFCLVTLQLLHFLHHIHQNHLMFYFLIRTIL